MRKFNVPWIAARHVSLYFFANGFKAGLPFLILPVLTRHITPAEYGLWGVFSALLSLLAPITALGLTTLVGRSYHLKSQEEHAGITYMASTLTGIASLILLLAVFILDYFTDEFFSIPVPFLYFLPFLCFFQNFDYLYKIILRHQGKAATYVLLEITSALVFRIGALLAVLYVVASWTSLLYVQFASGLLFFMIVSWMMKSQSQLVPTWEKGEVSEMLHMGWPLIPHALGGVIMVFSDRIILERMVDVEVVGVYSIAATVGGAILLFSTAFNNAWGPWMHRELRQATYAKKLKIVKYTYLYFIATFVVSLIIMGVSYFYINWFLDPAYHDAYSISLWLTAGTALFGMSYAVTHYLIILGKTKILPVVTGFSAVLNICLTIVLVDYNGAIGAAQATFIAYVVFLASLMWQSQKCYPMPWLLKHEPS